MGIEVTLPARIRYITRLHARARSLIQGRCFQRQETSALKFNRDLLNKTSVIEFCRNLDNSPGDEEVVAEEERIEVLGSKNGLVSKPETFEIDSTNLI